MERLRTVADGFQIFGDLQVIEPYGSGHINDTYRVSVNLAGRPVHYLLQRINLSIFTDPVRLMENIRRVTEHQRAKLAAAGEAEPSRKALTIIPTRGGEPFLRDPEGNAWRPDRASRPGGGGGARLRPFPEHPGGSARAASE